MQLQVPFPNCHKKTLTINESFYIFKLIPTL